MKSSNIFLLCILFIFACKSHAPFTSLKEKKESIALIKNKINLTNEEFFLLKKEDSILFEISKSIEKNIRISLIKRRIDSFNLNSYTKNEFLQMLKVDRIGNGWEIELDRDGKLRNYHKMENYKEAEGFLKKVDSAFSKDNKVKMDTLRNK